MNESSAEAPPSRADFLALRHMLLNALQKRCSNLTEAVVAEVRALLQPNTTQGPPQAKSEDSLAVLYIVFVLLFFAASLLVLLVKYLRRERESTRLQKFYEDYLVNTQSSAVVHYDTHGRRLQPTTPESPHPSSPTWTPSLTPPTTPIDAVSLTLPRELIEHEF
ncbi:uncharacterized protein LOC135101422 [Scylla paramamosain]